LEMSIKMSELFLDRGKIILKEVNVLVEYKSLNVALEEGAIALFTEKYPENVRTVKIMDNEFISYELCGGTHVKNTSFIGVFKIISEKSLQLGVRRIEAVCNLPLLSIFDKFYSIVNNLAALTNTDIDKIKDYISKIISYSKNLKQNIINLKKKYYQLLLDSIKFEDNNIININLLEEDDLLIVHDLIKIKNPNYIGIYNVQDTNKVIIIFNSNLKELLNIFSNYNLKLINLGNFKKVIINNFSNQEFFKDIFYKIKQRN